MASPKVEQKTTEHRERKTNPLRTGVGCEDDDKIDNVCCLEDLLFITVCFFV